MKRLFKKKVSLFGKEISVFVVVLLAVGLVSAALLPFFGVITGSAIVSQSVEVEDTPITGEWNGGVTAGEIIVDCDNDDIGHYVRNNANVPATIQLGTVCNNSVAYDDGEQTIMSINWANECEGIDTEIYGILELSTKHTSDWSLNGNKATVKYTIIGGTFSAEVIDGVESGYELIYYKDDVDAQTVTEREANPQQAIQVNVIGSNNLPYTNDGNVQDGANYCGTPDNYIHCKGAKLWYVPTAALSSCTSGVCDIDWAQWDTFLYETDLIMYSSDSINKMTLPSNGGGFSFCVKNDFAINLAPDTYTIETKVLPVL